MPQETEASTKTTSKKLTLEQFITKAGMDNIQQNVVKRMFEKDNKERTYNQWLTACYDKHIFGKRQIEKMKRS